MVAAPALVEAYAVLTRLPPPHRLSPADALALLEADFIHPAKIITLDKRAYGAAIPGGRKNPVTTPTSQVAFRKHACDNTSLTGTI